MSTPFSPKENPAVATQRGSTKRTTIILPSQHSLAKAGYGATFDIAGIRAAIRQPESILATLQALHIPLSGNRHIRCPLPNHADRNPSWRYDLQRGRWFCSCGHGDLIDLVMAMLGCTFPEAVAFIQGDGGRSVQDRPAKPFPVVDDRESTQRAMAVWRQSCPVAGTLAERYLRQRGVNLPEWPESLRFHPGLWHGESRKAWPALVAAVSGADGKPCAVQRLWLDPVTGKKPQPCPSANRLAPSRAGRCGWNFREPPPGQGHRHLWFVRGLRTA